MENNSSINQRKEKKSRDFQNVAVNILKKPDFIKPIPIPNDFFSVPRMLNIEKTEYDDEEDDYDENEKNYKDEKFLNILNQQNAMLEKITSMFAQDREQAQEEKNLFLSMKLNRFDKYKDEPMSFYEKKDINVSKMNKNFSRHNIFDPLEIMSKYKKFKDKTKKNDIPNDFPPFLNYFAGPIGMYELPLAIIAPKFSHMDLENKKYFGLNNPFDLNVNTKDKIKRKTKRTETKLDQFYKYLMNEDVFYI